MHCPSRAITWTYQQAPAAPWSEAAAPTCSHFGTVQYLGLIALDFFFVKSNLTRPDWRGLAHTPAHSQKKESCPHVCPSAAASAPASPGNISPCLSQTTHLEHERTRPSPNLESLSPSSLRGRKTEFSFSPGSSAGDGDGRRPNRDLAPPRLLPQPVPFGITSATTGSGQDS